MVELFDDDEVGYLAWIHSNPDGFVANVDRALAFPQYPMVHSARHGLIKSPNIGGFTTGKYVKFCSTDFDALERYSMAQYGRALTRCAQCIRRADHQAP